MLRNLAIGKVVLERAKYMPSTLRPLVLAAEAGEPLAPALTSIVRNFGFDSFMYGMSVDPQYLESALLENVRPMCLQLFQSNGLFDMTKWHTLRWTLVYLRPGRVRFR